MSGGPNGVSGSNAWINISLLSEEAKRLDGSSGVQNAASTQPNDASSVSNGHSQPPAPPPRASQDAKKAGPSGDGYGVEDANKKAVEQALKELRESPEYRSKWEQQEALAQLMSEFAGLEAKWGNGGTDGLLSWDDIKCAVLNRDRGTSKAEMALADFLYENRELFTSIDKDGDGLIDKSELKSMLRTLQADLHTMEANAKSGATDTAKEGKKADDKSDDKKVEDGKADPTKDAKPFESSATDPGERMADAVGHLQSEIDRLQTEMANATAEGRTGDAQKYQAQIAKLQMCQQMAMSAMQQYTNMMSNIAKMWSDMAMAAIRNTH